MADHMVLQLRDRIVTVITDLATTADRVYKARVYPIQDTELPALTVRVGEVDQEYNSMGATPGILNKCTFMIRIHVSETSDVDAQIYLICKEVAEALGGDNNLNGLALAAYPAGISEPEYTSEGAQQMATVDLAWSAEWDCAINDWD